MCSVFLHVMSRFDVAYIFIRPWVIISKHDWTCRLNFSLVVEQILNCRWFGCKSQWCSLPFYRSSIEKFFSKYKRTELFSNLSFDIRRHIPRQQTRIKVCWQQQQVSIKFVWLTLLKGTQRFILLRVESRPTFLSREKTPTSNLQYHVPPRPPPSAAHLLPTPSTTTSTTISSSFRYPNHPSSVSIPNLLFSLISSSSFAIHSTPSAFPSLFFVACEIWFPRISFFNYSLASAILLRVYPLSHHLSNHSSIPTDGGNKDFSTDISIDSVSLFIFICVSRTKTS